MRLFDSHCHLQDPRFRGCLDGVRNRMSVAGVERLLCCGTRPGDWASVTEIAARMEGSVPAYGIHPWYADEAVDSWEEDLIALLVAFPEACVGEIGLDAVVRPQRVAAQRELFVRQLELAREHNRPVSIHCRRAWGGLLEALRGVGRMQRGVVVHSFSGSVEMVPELAELGVFFSFSGSVCNPEYVRAGDRVRAVPRDRLLVETDSPDMLPHTLRGYHDRNEPANLPLVVEQVGQFLGLPAEQVAELTWANACCALGPAYLHAHFLPDGGGGPPRSSAFPFFAPLAAIELPDLG